MDIQRCSCSIQNPGDPTAPPKTFTFDGVYPTGSNTEQLYNEIAYPLVEGVLEGYNSTVFAYGQTGCGKSFTMQGVREPANQRGIIPRAFEHVFEAVAVDAKHRFLVLASYLEIYNEEIRDLLGNDSRRSLELRENPEKGVYVHDLSSHPVQSVADCERLMDRGWRNRSVGATLMNAESSSSCEMMAVEEGCKAGLMGPSSARKLTDKDLSSMGDMSGRIRRGKLNLVDLAGSERQAKTGATGERLKEAMKINLSLSALGNVISALVDGKSKHIPYRDSKLTRLLQDSLGGNTKTLMVACLSPADNNYDETLSTLRYANRAKNISNRPHINEDPKDTMLREYQDEIRKLKELLASGSGAALGAALSPGREAPLLDADKIRREYEQEMARLRAEYQAEQDTKAQLQDDLSRLREQFEAQMAEVERQRHQQPPQGPPQQGQGPPSPGSGNNAAREKVLRRLQKLEQAMVGGERADDSALKERRMRRRRAAQQRLQMLSQVLAKVEDEDGTMLKVYDDIQEELRVKTEALRKNRQKVRALDREISDLHSEFENERTDYLETIRRQQRQLQLVNQILEKIVPTLRRECNYSNLERVKQDAVWNEDLERWRIPDLVVSRTKLPPPVPLDNAFTRGLDLLANGANGAAAASNGSSGKSSVNGSASLSPDNSDRASSPGSDDGSAIILQRLARSEAEDIAGNYFKPRRANELLSRARAQRDAARVISRWRGTS
ncbi:hypothetical protein ONE63_009921 [Megalurothrips usitatus]|uniref:Kinesin-like protein n=1 Tax=Megalurothrips usitatus TaxID=439358 RepID=A0AAV7XNR2_9NEOP|nr:hypothetical protein ONE63_009921 [Megalurothrips usitatus]